MFVGGDLFCWTKGKLQDQIKTRRLEGIGRNAASGENRR